MDSLTPRTDALAKSCKAHYLALDLARTLERELATCRELYHELLYQVGNKYPDETRHQTALRYLRKAESNVGEGQAQQERKL